MTIPTTPGIPDAPPPPATPPPVVPPPPGGGAIADPKTSPFADLTKQGLIVVPWMSGMRAGQGYDALLQVVKGSAADEGEQPQFEVAGTESQKVFQMTKRVEDTTELANSLSITAEADGGFGAFSASASASYEKDVNINNYSIFFLASIQVLNQEELLTKTLRLDPRATRLSATDFRNKFGDYFVSGVVTGGYFWSLLQMETDSESTKEDISASLKAHYDAGVSAGGSFSTDIKRAMSHNGVKVSFFTERAGSEGSWAQGEPMSTYEDIEKVMTTYAASVAKAGAPICAILTPYSVLLEYAYGPSSIDEQAVGTILDSLRQSYLDARQILGSLDYAVDHPEQFPPGVTDDLPGAQAQVRAVIQKIGLLVQQLRTDPATPIDLPPLPWGKIPRRLWGGAAVAIAPPADVVLAGLAPAIAKARYAALRLPDQAQSAACVAYVDAVAADVRANLGKAWDSVQSLTGTMAAFDGGVASADARALAADFASSVEDGASALTDAIAEQQAKYADLASTAPGGHIDFLEQGLNQVVWNTASGRAAGAAFWKDMGAVAGQVSTLAATWEPSASGDRRYDFPHGAWSLLASRLHDAREAF